jgi:NAD(P)-dependent dehydrogenase (short-subunit alcohol dehydrogenase family)
MKKVLITGAGTGFGPEVAMRLALKGFDVIAAVEIYAQIQTLKREAAARGVTLRVEKLDVTNEGDRKKALAWNIEILVNNAGVLEGGSVLDIPGSNMRHEFEVNVRSHRRGFDEHGAFVLRHERAMLAQPAFRVRYHRRNCQSLSAQHQHTMGRVCWRLQSNSRQDGRGDRRF